MKQLLKEVAGVKISVDDETGKFSGFIAGKPVERGKLAELEALATDVSTGVSVILPPRNPLTKVKYDKALVKLNGKFRLKHGSTVAPGEALVYEERGHKLMERFDALREDAIALQDEYEKRRAALFARMEDLIASGIPLTFENFPTLLKESKHEPSTEKKPGVD